MPFDLFLEGRDDTHHRRGDADDGGGTVPVPDWFKDWCADQGIEIKFVDGQDSKSNLEPPPGDEKFPIQPKSNP